jgi:GH25 family lysozyme M1 (1,4-beta-N-acetylmuramidase)
MTITLGVDVSHYQGNPNFAQVKASGNLFVCQKATESTNYVDPTYATNRRNAHGAGLVFGSYHFSRYGNVNAEADWFTSHAQVINGEFVMLDWEISAPDPVGWSLAWLKRVEANLGVKPFIYLNSAAMNGYNWGPVADSGYPLWLAKYDFVTTSPTTKWWPLAAMKQFSDRDSVPGIAGLCDHDVFYGSLDQLIAYTKGSISDMALTDADKGLIHSAVWQGPGDPNSGKGIWVADRVIATNDRVDHMSPLVDHTHDLVVQIASKVGQPVNVGTYQLSDQDKSDIANQVFNLIAQHMQSNTQ